MQRTVGGKLEFGGPSLHTNVHARMAICPAPPNHGVVFRRVDSTRNNCDIPARHENVTSTRLCTKIANSEGVSVMTIEHVMAGLAACGVTNSMIEIDGPEVPALDGSALAIAEAILDSGVLKQQVPCKVLQVLSPVEVAVGDSTARLEPLSGAAMSFKIAFPEPIGNQSCSMSLSNGAIVRSLIVCRTFCTSDQVEAMHREGYGCGGTLQNVLVANVETNGYSSRLRCEDECVKHKMLDAVGDLALVGYPIIGHFKGNRSGHGTTHALLKKLLGDNSLYRILEADKGTASILPGEGVTRSDIPTIH